MAIIIIIMAAFWGGGNSEIAAVFEWTLADFYGIYVLILVYDLYPAALSSKGQLLESRLGQGPGRPASWISGLRNGETFDKQDMHVGETFYRNDSTTELRHEAESGNLIQQQR
jgi:hypothetical protein